MPNNISSSCARMLISVKDRNRTYIVVDEILKRQTSLNNCCVTCGL